MTIRSFAILMALGSISVSAYVSGGVHYSLPPNDLWKQDRLNNIFAENVAEETMFNKIVDAGYEIYKPMADQWKEKLVINKKWTNSTVNADTSRFFGKVTINMYGGLARRKEINPEGFALVLCHELGHAYGGIPYIQKYNKMSAEGQADYYGAKECVRAIVAKLQLDGYQQTPTGFMEKSCAETTSNQGDYDLCLRGLTAGQALGKLLAVISKEKSPDYETPDKTVVNETILSYPNTVQCRLDTYFSGVTGKNRPLCWFKPDQQ